MNLANLRLIFLLLGMAFNGQIAFSQNSIINAAGFADLGEPDSVFVDSTEWPRHGRIYHPVHFRKTYSMHFDSMYFEVLRTGSTVLGLRKVDPDSPWQALYMDSIFREDYPPPFDFREYSIPLDFYRLWQSDPTKAPDTVYEYSKKAHILRELKSSASWIEASEWLSNLANAYPDYKIFFWRLDEPRIEVLLEGMPVNYWKSMCKEVTQSINEDAWFSLDLEHYSPKYHPPLSILIHYQP